MCELNDTQAGLMMLPSRASFGELVYSARTSPTALIANELGNFDQAQRSTFCELTRLDLDGDAWARAQWASGVGGLGLRSCHWATVLARTRPLRLATMLARTRPLGKK